MTDINKICAAMAALVNALPGKSGRYTSISMHNCDDARFRAIVDAGGVVRRFQNDAGTEEWDLVELAFDGVTIAAYTDHRPIVRREADPATVEAALAQAQEAIQ